MELLFLLIFFLFIVLNVVIGLVSSRAKKRRAALQKPTEEYASGVPETDRRTEDVRPSAEGRKRGANEYFLQEQTSDSLVRSMYEETADRERELHDSVEVMEKTPVSNAGPPSIPESVAVIAETETPLAVAKSGEQETPPEFPYFEGEKEESLPPGSGWEHLKRLPSLQRAVILSEILGPPCALSERTHSHQ
jgi:hypothetical protein